MPPPTSSTACTSSRIAPLHGQSCLVFLRTCELHCCNGRMFWVAADAFCILPRIPRLCVGKTSVSPATGNMYGTVNLLEYHSCRATNSGQGARYSAVTHWRCCADWTVRKSWSSHYNCSHDNLARPCTVLYSLRWSCVHRRLCARMKRGRCACDK